VHVTRKLLKTDIEFGFIDLLFDTHPTGIPSPVFGCVIGANNTGRFLRRCATGLVRLRDGLIARAAIR
jgi:hypothetical protein